MKSVLGAVAALLLLGGSPVLAANVSQPYQNVDRGNDAGNSTGDNKVDTLNRGQLDENQKPAGQTLGGNQVPPPAAPAR